MPSVLELAVSSDLDEAQIAELRQFLRHAGAASKRMPGAARAGGARLSHHGRTASASSIRTGVQLPRHGRATAASTAAHRTLQLPEKLYKLLLRIVEDLADGKMISITSPTHELTTQEAANLLGMSRQFLVRLLDGGKIPFHRVGTHRRVYLRDLLTFRNERDRRRHEAIQEMARDAVKDGVYDDS